jgi:formylmethanofuran dehydrogenase subunit E
MLKVVIYLVCRKDNEGVRVEGKKDTIKD